MGAESVAGTLPVLKIYDGAYHQLLNEPNRDEIIRDLAALSKEFFFSKTSDPLIPKKGPTTLIGRDFHPGHLLTY